MQAFFWLEWAMRFPPDSDVMRAPVTFSIVISTSNGRFLLCHPACPSVPWNRSEVNWVPRTFRGDVLTRGSRITILPA